MLEGKGHVFDVALLIRVRFEPSKWFTICNFKLL